MYPHVRLTERIGVVGIGRRRRLFGVQWVGEARSLMGACEGIQDWFTGDRTTGMMQTGRGRRGGGMRGKLLLLHQQCLVQLALMLLDLLLHVGDCTCNLDEKDRRYNGHWHRSKGQKRIKKKRFAKGRLVPKHVWDRILRKKWHKHGLVHPALWWWRVENKKRRTNSPSQSQKHSLLFITSKVFSWEHFKAWAIHTLTSCGGCCHMRNYVLWGKEVTFYQRPHGITLMVTHYAHAVMCWLTCCSCCRMGPETLRCACIICCWICKRWYACFRGERFNYSLIYV